MSRLLSHTNSHISKPFITFHTFQNSLHTCHDLVSPSHQRPQESNSRHCKATHLHSTRSCRIIRRRTHARRGTRRRRCRTRQHQVAGDAGRTHGWSLICRPRGGLTCARHACGTDGGSLSPAWEDARAGWLRRAWEWPCTSGPCRGLSGA
jgi:hypothetical protein